MLKICCDICGTDHYAIIGDARVALGGGKMIWIKLQGRICANCFDSHKAELAPSSRLAFEIGRNGKRHIVRTYYD